MLIDGKRVGLYAPVSARIPTVQQPVHWAVLYLLLSYDEWNKASQCAEFFTRVDYALDQQSELATVTRSYLKSYENLFDSRGCMFIGTHMKWNQEREYSLDSIRDYLLEFNDWVNQCIES
jgi:hypothetical protein